MTKAFLADGGRNDADQLVMRKRSLAQATAALSEFIFLICLHHRRSSQHSSRQFQVVQIFTAEVLSEARIQAFA